MLYAFKDEVDPIAGRLARLLAWAAGMPTRTGWLIGLTSVLGVALLDALGRGYGLRCFPLYIPLICLGGWTMAPRSALLFAGGTAILAMVPDWSQGPLGPQGYVTAINAGLRLLVYLALAMILSACRRSYDIARVFASLDSLTQVLNKASFHREFRRLLEARRASSTWLSVAFVDLDDFRTINGAYGHAAGDDVLRRFSSTAITNIRRGDLIGRIGGDEFAIVIRAIDKQTAHSAAQSLHARFMDTLADAAAPATCSMGVVILPPNFACSEPGLIEAADRLMYRVKDHGKGAILLADANDALRVAA
jgi:diguanylate cyclase (GGDEF)-like protein